MSNLFVQDNRPPQILPQASRNSLILPYTYGRPDQDRIYVSSQTPLQDFIDQFLAASALRGPFHKMVIVAHGEGRRLLFCREALDIFNMKRLLPLQGRVERIKLLACNMAGEANGGVEFCRQMALITRAHVIASPDIQVLSSHSIDRWEGAAVTFSPDGQVSRREFGVGPAGHNNSELGY